MYTESKSDDNDSGWDVCKAALIVSLGAVMTNGWDVAGAVAAVLALALLLWELWGRSYRRSHLLKNPVKVDIVIPPVGDYEVNYATQTKQWQRVNALTLPSDSEVVIQFNLWPRFSFKHQRTIFSFEGSGSLPKVIDQNNLLYPGTDSMRILGAPTIHGAYELQPNSEQVKGVPFDHGFVVRTSGAGCFEAVLSLVAEQRQCFYKFHVTVAEPIAPMR